VNQNHLGCYAEYLFVASAIGYGFNVSMPSLDASHYDCILEKNKKLFKIQVKFVGSNRKKSKYHKYSRQIVLRRGYLHYEIEDVDFFAIYKQDENGFYIIKNTKQKSLRLRPNGKYKNNFNNFAMIS